MNAPAERPLPTAPIDVDPKPTIPEYGCSRRRFLIYAVMCGFAPPERAVERVVAELKGETT